MKGRMHAQIDQEHHITHITMSCKLTNMNTADICQKFKRGGVQIYLLHISFSFPESQGVDLKKNLGFWIPKMIFLNHEIEEYFSCIFDKIQMINKIIICILNVGLNFL